MFARQNGVFAQNRLWAGFGGGFAGGMGGATNKLDAFLDLNAASGIGGGFPDGDGSDYKGD